MMGVKEHLPGTDDPYGPTTAVLMRYYVVPILGGWLLAFVLATWTWTVTGGPGIWALAAIAAFLGAVMTVVLEEVVYDG